MAIARDPAGLLERIPELRELSQHSSALAKAIEGGRPHAVYRQLLWMRWFGRAPVHRSLLDALLKSRRLFLEPLRGAPWLTTVNGVGTTVYGASDADPNDGTYVKTLFLVFVFIPLYPFASYLVRQPENGDRGWLFIAKVPLSPILLLWQRGLALALIAVVAIGGARTYIDSRYRQIHVANALPISVEAQIDGRRLAIAPRSVESVRVRLGDHAVKILATGREIETGNIEATRGGDVQIWNVLGFGLLYEEVIEYRSKTATENVVEQPAVHCGETAISISGADYVFTEPPQRLNLDSKTQVIRKKRVALEMKASCAAYFMSKDQPKRAAELLARSTELAGFDETQTSSALELLSRFVGPEAALAFAGRALAARPSSVPVHRTYQDVLVYHGRRTEAIERYRRRWQGHEGEPDAAYLYARLLPDARAMPIVERALTKDPEHAYLLRMRAYIEEKAGHPDRCLEALSALRRVAPAAAFEAFGLELHALVAVGNVDAARTRVLYALKDAEAGQREELAKWAVLLSRFAPPTDAQAILDSMKEGTGKLDRTSHARVRIEGRLPVESRELEVLEPGPRREALWIELLTRTDPSAALRSVANAEDAALRHLSIEVWALLLGEAAHSDAETRALEALSRDALSGADSAKALVKYVREGGDCAELEALPPPVRAALHLARSRAVTLASDERQSLLALARREDALHGLVTEALDTWK